MITEVECFYDGCDWKGELHELGIHLAQVKRFRRKKGD